MKTDDASRLLKHDTNKMWESLLTKTVPHITVFVRRKRICMICCEDFSWRDTVDTLSLSHSDKLGPEPDQHRIHNLEKYSPSTFSRHTVHLYYFYRRVIPSLKHFCPDTIIHFPLIWQITLLYVYMFGLSMVTAITITTTAIRRPSAKT